MKDGVDHHFFERSMQGVLLLAAVLTSWLVWHFVINMRFAAPSSPRYPDAFVRDLQVTMMDTSGRVQYIFASPSMQHYEADDRTVFLKPVLTAYQTEKNPAEPPWHIAAEEGEAFNGNTEITLKNNVVLQQAASRNNASTLIKTAELSIYPDRQIAQTAQYIEAIQLPTGQISSIGMRFNLATGVLDLLSGVKGVYYPAVKK